MPLPPLKQDTPILLQSSFTCQEFPDNQENEKPQPISEASHFKEWRPQGESTPVADVKGRFLVLLFLTCLPFNIDFIHIHGLIITIDIILKYSLIMGSWWEPGGNEVTDLKK